MPTFEIESRSVYKNLTLSISQVMLVLGEIRSLSLLERDFSRGQFMAPNWEVCLLISYLVTLKLDNTDILHTCFC